MQKVKISQVKNLSVKELNYKNIILTWDKMEHANYYIISRSISGKPYEEFGTVADSNEKLTVKTGKEYKYKIKGVYDHNEKYIEGDFSDSVSVKTKLEDVPVLSLQKKGIRSLIYFGQSRWCNKIHYLS